MILTGTEIVTQRAAGRIHLEPFDPALVNPNSVDVRLAPTLRVYANRDELDPARDNPTTELHIPCDGRLLVPGVLYLGSTVETVGTDHYVAVLEGKSSLGRLGLTAHITAGFIDCGFRGQVTLEITVVHPFRVYPGMRIGQICYTRPEGVITLYAGKYQAQTGPQASRSWADFQSTRE